MKLSVGRIVMTAAAIDAIAARVYEAQERRLGNPAPAPWAKLSSEERWPWRDGVRVYLAQAIREGWRPPATKRGTRKRVGPGSGEARRGRNQQGPTERRSVARPAPERKKKRASVDTS